nr:DoxX family membrane protein [Bacteriovorax sp. HI3]
MFQKIALASRLLLGLMFTVFGLNGVLLSFLGKGFIPMPPPEGVMATIMAGFMATGYILPLAFLCELLGGLALLSGLFVNAGIIFLGPVIVNILGIHLFAEPTGLPMAIVVAVLFVIVVKSRWAYFKPMLNMR